MLLSEESRNVQRKVLPAYFEAKQEELFVTTACKYYTCVICNSAASDSEH